jgi:glutathione S-transferase
MKFFFYPHAPYSRKVMLAAYEKGITFEESEVVPPFDRAAMARLRAEHEPLATVPLLMLDDGSYLMDSSIICEYLDQHPRARPGVTLVPEGRADSLAVRYHDRFAELLLHPTVHLTWALHEPVEKQNAAKIDSTRKAFRTALGMLEKRLEGKTFVFGDSFTLADIGPSCAVADAVHVWSTRSELDPFPNVTRWYDLVQTRDSWHQVHEASKLVVPPF